METENRAKEGPRRITLECCADGISLVEAEEMDDRDDLGKVMAIRVVEPQVSNAVWLDRPAVASLHRFIGEWLERTKETDDAERR